MIRYPFLRLMIIAYRVFALMIIITSFFGVGGALLLALSRAARAGWLVPYGDAVSMALMCGGVFAGLVVGLTLLVAAELVMVFIDIETNTRGMRGLMRRQIEADEAVTAPAAPDLPSSRPPGNLWFPR